MRPPDRASSRYEVGPGTAREGSGSAAAEDRTVSGAVARVGRWLEWLNAPGRDDALLACCIESDEDMLDCGLRHIG